MNKESLITTEHRTLEVMEQYGGSFAKALARAWRLADIDNARRLRDAFPELWGRYAEMAKKVEARDAKDE